jgi:menaquinone-dependent protoporphyrinogen oxidase
VSIDAMGSRPPKVLVTAASKYGATAEIARAVGEVLAARGLEVSVLAPERVTTVDGYDACVIGSAVYAGRWRKEVKDLVERVAEPLRVRPVWLFSSGMASSPPKATGDPSDAVSIIEAAQPRDHRMFTGRLDRARLGFFERRLMRAVKASYGDYRDWSSIRAWAATIADTLQSEA